MLVISNNCVYRLYENQEEPVIRVNLAWCENLENAREVLKHIFSDVFLDYPSGRTKPPRPELTLDEAIILLKEFDNVKYFAISNCENSEFIWALRRLVPKNVKLVPKIESKKGVDNLLEIVKSAETDTVMLDKEDLYLDVKTDSSIYNQYMSKIRQTGKENGIKILEMQGVIFYERT